MPLWVPYFQERQEEASKKTIPSQTWRPTPVVPGEGEKAGGLLKCEASWGYSKTPTEENEVLLSSVASGSVNKSRTGQPLQSEDQDDGWG